MGLMGLIVLGVVVSVIALKSITRVESLEQDSSSVGTLKQNGSSVENEDNESGNK